MRFLTFSALLIFLISFFNTPTMADHLESVDSRCGYTFFYPKADGTKGIGLELKSSSTEEYAEFAVDGVTKPFQYLIKGGDRFMFNNENMYHKDLNLIRADYIAVTKNTKIKDISLCIKGRRPSRPKNGKFYLYPTNFEIKENRKIFLNPSEIPGDYEITNPPANLISNISKITAYPTMDYGVLFFIDDPDPLRLALITNFPTCKGLLTLSHFPTLITDDPHSEHTHDGMSLARQSKETLIQTLTIPCDEFTPPASENLLLTWTFTKQTPSQNIVLQLEGKMTSSVKPFSDAHSLILNRIKKTKHSHDPIDVKPLTR